MPGKPEMKVVRSARPGMRARSLASSARVCAWGGRFMDSSVRLAQCCSGMSMYLATCAPPSTALLLPCHLAETPFKNFPEPCHLSSPGAACSLNNPALVQL